jgi:hypothetical protein
MLFNSVLKGMSHANPNSVLFTWQIVLGILLELGLAILTPISVTAVEQESKARVV